MYKKMAGAWLFVLLTSSMLCASPFDNTKVTVDSKASDENLEITNDKATESEEKNETESESSEESDSTESKTSQYTVAAGDCLSTIAARLLGDINRWPEIVELNKDKYPSLLTNPNLIYVGWELTIPGSKGTNKDSDKVASDKGSNNSSNKNKDSNKSDNSSNSSGKTNGSSTSNNGDAIITADSRVLHIGDSHSMGIYGKTIDGLMRETGASVKTEAYGGANPQWFMNGQRAVCGSYSKDENGKEVTTGNNQVNTPKLSDMLKNYKPSVLVVSLGANMVGYPESTQRTMVRSLLDQAKAAGCKIVWVGPPDSRKLSDSSCDRLYKVLQSELPKYDGVLVDSRKYTKYPSGGDGIHYWGTEGVAQAKNWANEAMNDIQGK